MYNSAQFDVRKMIGEGAAATFTDLEDDTPLLFTATPPGVFYIEKNGDKKNITEHFCRYLGIKIHAKEKREEYRSTSSLPDEQQVPLGKKNLEDFCAAVSDIKKFNLNKSPAIQLPKTITATNIDDAFDIVFKAAILKSRAPAIKTGNDHMDDLNVRRMIGKKIAAETFPDLRDSTPLILDPKKVAICYLDANGKKHDITDALESYIGNTILSEDYRATHTGPQKNEPQQFLPYSIRMAANKILPYLCQHALDHSESATFTLNDMYEKLVPLHHAEFIHRKREDKKILPYVIAGSIAAIPAGCFLASLGSTPAEPQPDTSTPPAHISPTNAAPAEGYQDTTNTSWGDKIIKAKNKPQHEL